MVDNDDTAMDRLRSCDPATGSHPDLHHLRTLIAAKAPASQGEDRATRIDDPVARGGRMGAPWIAAAAVAALSMGAGGYALGLDRGGETTTSAAGRSTDGAAASGEAARGEGMSGAAADTASATAAPDVVTGGPGMSSSSISDMGPVRLLAGEGLSTERTTGEVRAMTSDEDPQVFLDSWTDKLGIQGVSVPDNTFFGGRAVWADGVVVTVDDSMGLLTFSYEDIYGNASCHQMWKDLPAEEAAMMRTEWTTTMGGLPMPEPEDCDPVGTTKPTSERALSAAKDFLATTGIDADEYDLVARPELGDPADDQVMVEGQPKGSGGMMGQQWLNVTVDPEGVVSAYGSIGEMTSLGDYPVISPAEAVERFGQREFSMEYSVMVVDENAPADGGDGTSMTGRAVSMPDPGAPSPGMKIPMLRKDRTVVSAELVSGEMNGPMGGSMEVPAWKLVTSDGNWYAVMAVADEAIDWQSWGE